jgi:alpha-mannosidase
MKHRDRWTPQKITRRLELIQQLDYRQRHPIAPLKYIELSNPDDAPPIAPNLDDSGWETIPYNSYWGKWMTDFALRTTFDVPTDWDKDSSVSLYLPFGESGDFSHPESLAYIDGQSYASADRHHHEILLPDSVKDGQTHHLAFHGWTGLGGWEGGTPNTQLFMKECFVVQIDQPTREFIAMARVALDVTTQLDDNNPVKGLLYNALDDAFNILDTRDPLGTDAFYDSVAPALDALKKGIAEAGDPMDVDIIGVGHAHIDVAWLWTLGQTRRKVGRTFSNVLRLMEQYPDYHFTQSQPQLYKYTEQNYPEIFEGIKERVKEGRWELIGGTWVEPDCNAIGTESLARQFLLGRNYFRKHFGDVDTPVLWLPDTFGYSWALPQLIKQAGMEYFITHKMSWNQYNHMPDQVLWWQGMDGTKVLTHFLTTVGGYGGELLPHATTYNGIVDAQEVFSTWNNFRQKETHNELITAYGFGDGGGGPTREMLENVEQFKNHPGAPRVRPGTVREFMDRLRDEKSEDLPTWNGEFYLEYHRGTLTSQARTKWNNRKSEFLLHDAEFLASYASLIGDFTYPHEILNEAWELVCLNQFHDILPGSSITPVYEDADIDYAHIRELGESVRDNAISALAQSVSADATAIAINPTSFAGDRIGLLEGSADGLSAIGSDSSVMTQSVADGTLVALTGLAPFSITALSAGEGSSSDTGLSITKDGDNIIMENALIRLVVNSDGELSSIYDREADREVIEAGKTANQILAFEDRPMAFDAWDIDIYFEDRTENMRDVQSLEIIEDGAIRVGIETKRNYRSSTLIQRMYLTYNSKRIDFDTEIDWHESHIFLKAGFPVDILSPTVTYEIQWGNVERATHRNTSWDWAKFETAAQKWGDLSEGNYGVAILNDSKYGYEAKHNELRLSLLKSATSPDPQADQGRHLMTYSLLPHTGDWRGQVIEQAYDLNDPIILRSVENGDGSDTIDSLVQVDSPNVTIETVKQAEDGNGIIVRLYENHRHRGKVTIKAGFELAEAYHTNLLEENESAYEIVDNQITMPIRPYQIATLRLIAK